MLRKPGQTFIESILRSVSIDRAFHFIGMSKRYEKTTRIIITIPSFPQCASIFDDDVRATRRVSASRCRIQDLFPPLRPRIDVTTRGA